MCKVGRLELSPVAVDAEGASHSRKLLHGIDWQPCLSLLNSSQLAEVFQRPDSPTATFVQHDYHLKLVDILAEVSKRTLTELGEHERDSAKPHIQRYTDWLRSFVDAHAADHDRSEGGLERRLEGIEKSRPQWEVHTAVARSLLPILRGEVDPLAVIFPTNLAERYYVDIFERCCDSRFAKFLDLLSF